MRLRSFNMLDIASLGSTPESSDSFSIIVRIESATPTSLRVALVVRQATTLMWPHRGIWTVEEEVAFTARPIAGASVTLKPRGGIGRERADCRRDR